jgi:hypothetical protein
MKCFCCSEENLSQHRLETERSKVSLLNKVAKTRFFSSDSINNVKVAKYKFSARLRSPLSFLLFSTHETKFVDEFINSSKMT